MESMETAAPVQPCRPILPSVGCRKDQLSPTARSHGPPIYRAPLVSGEVRRLPLCRPGVVWPQCRGGADAQHSEILHAQACRQRAGFWKGLVGLVALSKAGVQRGPLVPKDEHLVSWSYPGRGSRTVPACQGAPVSFSACQGPCFCPSTTIPPHALRGARPECHCLLQWAAALRGCERYASGRRRLWASWHTAAQGGRLEGAWEVVHEGTVAQASPRT